MKTVLIKVAFVFINLNIVFHLISTNRITEGDIRHPVNMLG
jgi:hypothetical protein